MSMRSFLGGLLISLLLPAACFAQVSGQVLGIGFDNYYRPDCWTPMLVQLKAEKSGTYEVQVHQEDLDKDKCIFAQTVALTGSDDGQGTDQLFWMYFIPQPTDGGLLDTSRGGTLAELRQQLHVYVCTEGGRKQVAQLPITSTVTNLDASGSGPGAITRGRRLIIAVADGRDSPVWRDYENAVGVTEDVVFVNTQPRGLPEDVRGYEAVDTVVWFNAAVPDPLKPTEERRFRALQEYVREGGRLVICQPPQRDATAAFGDLLPVTVDSIVDRPDAGPLREMSRSRNLAASNARYRTIFPDRRPRPWDAAAGPFRVALATPKPGAVVERRLGDDSTAPATQPADHAPYIVRAGYGAGAVTWVAQNLADPGVTKVKAGWPYIWDRVFGWSNDTLITPLNLTEADKDDWANASNPYKPGPWVDIGQAFNAGMELSGRSTALVGLAVVFFIGYWLVAGPGLFIVLSAKSRAQLSWMLFAAAAVGATLITVLVVKLVVRGSPEMRHITLVRKAAGAPLVATSRFGLYIPRDGEQDLVLKGTDPGAVSYLTAFPSRPMPQDDAAGFTANLDYRVPVNSGASGDEVSVAIPYRSTLKKLASKWVGNSPIAIGGLPALDQSDEGSAKLTGKLTNGTGQPLKGVYLVYHDPGEQSGGAGGTDYVLYYPNWDKGAVLDIDAEFNNPLPQNRVPLLGGTGMDYGDLFNGQHKIRGAISAAQGQTGWAAALWYPSLEHGMAAYANGMDFDDAGREMRIAFPVASLIDLIPPAQNRRDDGPKRIDLLRRGVRQWNLSQAVSAGNLVVLAEAPGPMPVPLEVSGDTVGGDGTTFFQFVMPLRHIMPPPPAPASAPATVPATSTASPAPVKVGPEMLLEPGKLPSWKGE